MSASYVAIITDGNGRWARQGLPVEEGTARARDTVKAASVTPPTSACGS